jgi:phage terminase large subunit GpA-like protein
MSNELANHFMERIVSGLKRKSITKPSRWAENYRIMGGDSFPGPWRWKYHPWLREMHDSEAEMNCGQKAAQMGYTETVLNLTYFKMDIEGIDCLYVFRSV